MSRDNLGNEQTFILHSCIINDKRYDFVITPHRQTIGYIRAKGQTLRKKIMSKQKQIIQKQFSSKETQSSNHKQVKYKNFTS